MTRQNGSASGKKFKRRMAEAKRADATYERIPSQGMPGWEQRGTAVARELDTPLAQSFCQSCTLVDNRICLLYETTA